MSLTIADIKDVVAKMKHRSVGTVFVHGQRYYLWSPADGWMRPGPHKAAMRKRTKRPPRRPGY